MLDGPTATGVAGLQELADAPVFTVLQRLAGSPRGLAEAEERLLRFGENEPPRVAEVGPAARLGAAVRSPFVALLAALCGRWSPLPSPCGAARVPTTCRLDREVPLPDVVPGDLVVLQAGDVVPADLRVVSASDLVVDQTVLTGESLLAAKSAAVGSPGKRSAAHRAGASRGPRWCQARPRGW